MWLNQLRRLSDCRLLLVTRFYKQDWATPGYKVTLPNWSPVLKDCDFYKVLPPSVECKSSTTILSAKTRVPIDYLQPLCLIVGLCWQTSKGKKGKKEEGGKKDRAKSRMLNIEVVARGLMKLTMQVNSLLQVPHSPPPLPRFSSSAHHEESFGGWVVRGWGGGACRYPCMESLERVIQGQKPQY